MTSSASSPPALAWSSSIGSEATRGWGARRRYKNGALGAFGLRCSVADEFGQPADAVWCGLSVPWDRRPPITPSDEPERLLDHWPRDVQLTLPVRPAMGAWAVEIRLCWNVELAQSFGKRRVLLSQ
jgi:hypothetical protein